MNYLQKKATPRQIQRRENILRATLKLIESTDTHGFSVRELASEADVSVATIYNIYGSKEDVIVAAYEDFYKRAITENIRPDCCGLEKIMRVFELMLTNMANKPNFARAIIATVSSFSSAQETSQEKSKISREILLEANSVMEDGIREMQDKGVLIDIEPGVIAHELTKNFWGASVYWSAGELSMEQLNTQVYFSLYLTLLGLTPEQYQPEFRARMQPHIGENNP
ncbi:MAG: TetR/AcrR family transcriptional regulator [bacterium]